MPKKRLCVGECGAFGSFPTKECAEYAREAADGMHLCFVPLLLRGVAAVMNKPAKMNEYISA